MPYTPQSWNNNDLSTPLSAARLLHMESGLTSGSPGGTLTLDTASTATAGTALNAAMSTLGAGGGTIFIPAGTWTIDTAVLINQVGVTFRGAANGSTLLQFAGLPGTSAFKMADTTQRRVYFDNLRIESTNDGAGTAIDASYFVNSIFNNLQIGNTGASPNRGIFFGGPGGGVTFYNVVRDSRIQVAGLGSIGLTYTADAISNFASNVRIIGDDNSTGVYVDAHSIKLERIDIESSCSIGVDVTAEGHECMLDHPYLQDLTGTGLNLASGVQCFTLLGGFIADCGTANITDSGAVSPYFANARVQYAPFTVAGAAEVTTDTDLTLGSDANGRRFVAIAAITISLPAPGVFGNGFECEIVNDSGGNVIIDGLGSTNVTLSNGDMATVIEANGKQRVVTGTTTVVADSFVPLPLWDPSAFGLDFDLVHWWDASTGVTLDATTGKVSGWTDKVRSATTTQTTAIKQPTWDNSDEIRFNGSGRGLILNNQGRASYESKWWLMLFRFNWTAMATSQDTYFFAVNGIANTNGQQQPRFNFRHATHQIDTLWYSNSGAVSVTVNVPGADDTWHSLVCRRTDDHIYASIDGAAEVSLACYPRAFLDSGSSPTGWFGNGTGTSLQIPNFGLDTLLWGQRTLTAGEIEKLHAWALWKRGAQASLDAGSPYLLDAPTMARSEVHVALPDSYADGYRFPTTGGWDDTTRGTALDLTGFTRTFHDHFTSISTVTDGLTGAGQWWAPAHIDTSDAKFRRPSQNPTDTYTILPDNTTLQIKMSQIGGVGAWYSGHIQTADAWRNGFTQSCPIGGSMYFEARIALNNANGWPAFWLYTTLDGRDSAATKCEIDIVEAYGDNLNSQKQIHLAGHNHGAYRPQPGNVGSVAGTVSHTPSKVVDATQSPFNVAGTLFDGTGAGLPGTFHTYGVMIDETWMTWYFDGVVVSRFPTFKEALGPLYMIISLQAQGGTVPTQQTYMWIDYADIYST